MGNPMGIETYSRRAQFYTGEVPSLLLQFLDQRSWNTFLDLGCGDGALLGALSSEGIFSGKTVYAVDLSETRIGLVKGINKDFICLLGDACDTGVQAGSIDFLISTQVIEHVRDDAKMVKEMHRIVSPNGTVYLSTVFKKWYGWYFYRCNGKWTLDPTHLREYTRELQLLGLFEQAGFEILKSQKSLDGRPLIDAVLRRIGASRNVYENRCLKLLRKVKIPIPGYYIWEIVGRRRP